MIKAIIFDCWNTLFYDDMKPEPFIEFTEKLGKSMGDYSYLKVFEKNLMLERCNNVELAVKGILRDLKIKADRSLVKELADILAKKGIEYVRPYPRTLENLNKLKKRFKLALISNAFSPGFEKLEEKYNLRGIFDVIVLSYGVGLIKPDPKIFEIVLKRLGSKKEETLMVGDSLEDDVRAAEKFGVNSLLFDIKNKHPEFNKRIVSLDEMESYLIKVK